MGNFHLLVTGDYWHQDFQSVLQRTRNVAITFVPLDACLQQSQSEGNLDLVVVAAARRDQFSAQAIEQLRESCFPTPVIALLGSWTEGEVRSGTPWMGIPRVYWHQWPALFAWFEFQQSAGSQTGWQLPATASIGDRIRHDTAANLPSLIAPSGISETVGISALTSDSFLALADAVHALGGIPAWLEQMEWNALDPISSKLVCVDADGWSPALEQRIQWIDSFLPDANLIVTANFPRQSDVELLHAAGVAEVVSKPFELAGLAAILEKLRTQSPA